MNDMNTHAHSDAMVIDADVRESYRELCEEHLYQLDGRQVCEDGDIFDDMDLMAVGVMMWHLDKEGNVT